VEDGRAVAVPELDTLPPPLSRYIEEAPETFQLRMELFPLLIYEGLAVK
jgi:hypothetical protein